jgi:hypothetical protein
MSDETLRVASILASKPFMTGLVENGTKREGAQKVTLVPKTLGLRNDNVTVEACFRAKSS